MAEQRTESERIIAIEATYEHLATKADIANLRTDIANLRTELKADDAALSTELKEDIGNLREEFVAFQTSVNTSFGNIKWFITIAVAAGAVGVTIINVIVTVLLALFLRAA